MFTFTKSKNIPLTLQLIKSDGTIEQGATVSYIIYDANASTIIVTQKSAIWNNTLQGYFDWLEVAADWQGQVEGNYILKWSISGAASFPTTLVDNIQITPGGIEDTFTISEFANIIFSVLANKSSTINNIVKFRDYADSKDRVIATVDNKGNRLSITIDCDD